MSTARSKMKNTKYKYKNQSKRLKPLLTFYCDFDSAFNLLL